MIYYLVLGFLFEYIGDFYFQTREIALRKSNEIKILLLHSFLLGFILFGGFFFFTKLTFSIILQITISYSLLHGIQDWFLWRGYKERRAPRFLEYQQQGKEYPYWEDKMFYDFIGLDRTLHIITLTLIMFHFI